MEAKLDKSKPRKLLHLPLLFKTEWILLHLGNIFPVVFLIMTHVLMYKVFAMQSHQLMEQCEGISLKNVVQQEQRDFSSIFCNSEYLYISLI